MQYMLLPEPWVMTSAKLKKTSVSLLHFYEDLSSGFYSKSLTEALKCSDSCILFHTTLFFVFSWESSLGLEVLEY